MFLPITMTIGAAAALLNVWLMVRCGQARGKTAVSVGDGGNEFMARRMRAHANFVESAPFVLILIGALELAGSMTDRLWSVGIIYIIARIAHMFGMEGGALAKGRFLGALFTLIILASLAVMALYTVYTTMPVA